MTRDTDQIGAESWWKLMQPSRHPMYATLLSRVGLRLLRKSGRETSAFTASLMHRKGLCQLRSNIHIQTFALYWHPNLRGGGSCWG